MSLVLGFTTLTSSKICDEFTVGAMCSGAVRPWRWQMWDQRPQGVHRNASKIEMGK